MATVQTEFDALASAVVALADHAMRASYVRQSLLGKCPEVVADLFTVAMSSAETRTRPHTELLQAISLALADETCDGLREAVRCVLESRQQASLARALQRDAVEEEAETQRIPDFGKGRSVTLGERKSLARRSDRELIARVLRDPHPAVIRILLGNPLLTEPDIVRLCSRRPASTEVLREVFRCARWIVRYPVKVTLSLNPYTPLDVTLQLAPHLQAPDLRRVVSAEDLHDTLREACRLMLGRTSAPVLH
jgi:hypothetical protein